jgi:hypothetical protein
MALSRARLPLLAATVFSFATAVDFDAHAWTPTTHVYLAQKAWEDAQDGKVTINTVDHDGRSVNGTKGDYDVSPEILIAIRQNPHAFYAGVLGPDAYPDILTGQMRIHPPGHGYGGPDANTNGPGTDAWLTKLWNAAHTGADRTNPNLAFATGYLSHAAGDMFAHTFMNTFTGGIFDLTGGANGVKHIVLEGYVGARVPAFNPVSYPFGGIFGGEAVPTNGSLPIYEAVDRFGIDNGVREFIARTMIDPPAVAVGVGQAGGVEKNRQFSIPAIFSDLRQELRSSVSAYEAQDSQYAARANYTGRLAYWAYTDMPAVVARACGKKATETPAACPDPTFSPSTCPPEYPTGDPGMCFLGLAGAAGFAVAMSFLSAGANVEWGAWKTLGLRELNYIRQRSQIHEIDLGLESWIETSHNAALAWFFNPDGSPDVSGFIDEYTWFATHRLISMTTGLPSWPIDTFGAIVDFIPNLIKPHFEKMKRDFVEYIIQTTFGMDSRSFRDKYTKPYLLLDSLYAGNRPSMSIARINAIMNVPSFDISDIGNPVVTRKTWTVDVTPQQKIFPAAYNTMVMIKLLMMKPSEVDRLIRDLGGAATLGPQLGNSIENNPMLGFAETIDGSHQWLNGKKLVFARECSVYRQLFMNQRPWPALPNEPTDPNLQAGVEPVDSGACKLMGNSRGFPGLQTTPPAPPPAPATKQLPPPPPPPFQIASSDVKALAAGELPSHPPNTLFPGQSLVLSLAPSDVPHKWSIVSGGGKLSDPPDPVTGQSPQAQAAKIAEIEKKAARTALSGSTCGKGDLKCLQKTHNDVATIKKERRTALAGMRVVRATPLTLGTVIYEAPPTMTGNRPQIVTVKAEATDGSGRSTTITLTLLPQPPALNVKAPTSVRAGGTFALVNDPPIPVKWTIVSGGGTIGDPQSPVRAQLMAKDITPFINGMRQADTKLTALPPEPTAPPPSPTPNRFDRGPGGTVLKANLLSATPQIAPAQRQQAMTDKATLVRDRQKDLAAAAKKVEEIDGTYKAPVKVVGGQSVVIKGVALDGTGRTTTITVQLTP